MNTSRLIYRIRAYCECLPILEIPAYSEIANLNIMIINSPKLNSSVSPGDIKYKDISGPDGIPDGVISPEYDRKLLGGSLPRYTFGGSFNIDWHNLDFGVTFNGIGKHKVSKMIISKPLEAQLIRLE